VPDMLELKRRILEEGHMSSLCIHSRPLSCIKKDIYVFVYACLVCQKSKVEQQKSSGLIQPLTILEWKWTILLWTLLWVSQRLRKGVIQFEGLWIS